MSTLSNYEGLRALSSSPHMSDTMRAYLVGVLDEHREMCAALKAFRFAFKDAKIECHGLGNTMNLGYAIELARNVLAKVDA